MKRNSIILMALFFISMILCSTTLIQPVNCASYYNWIENSSFEIGQNIIEDESFESADYEQGVEYGNWSGDFLYSTTQKHTGQYAGFSHYSGNQNIWYNFTSDYYFLGSELETFNFYMYNQADNDAREFSLIWYYSDDSSDTYEQVGTLPRNSWVYYDVIDEELMPDLSKTVVAFKLYITLSDLGNYYIDDVRLTIYGTGENQDEITATSEPWYLYDPAFATESFWVVDSEIVDDVARTGNNSYYIIQGAGGWDLPPVRQNIENLDASNVYYIDMYVLNPDLSSITIQCVVHYIIGSSDSRTITVYDDADWQYINFGVSWIDDSQEISEIGFVIDGVDTTNGIWIDDIGLWASVPTTFIKHSFSFTPSPIYGYQGYTVALRPNIAYTLTLRFYNSTGQQDGDGVVVISSNQGSDNEDLTDGLLIYPLDVRTYTSVTTEYISITAVIDGEDDSFYITVIWTPLTSATPTPPPEEITGDLLNWLVVFFVMFLPAILFGASIYENNQQPDAMHIPPIYGVIAGLVLSIGIGIYTSIIPIWLLILAIIAIVILFVGMIIK